MRMCTFYNFIQYVLITTREKSDKCNIIYFKEGKVLNYPICHKFSLFMQEKLW